MIQSTQCHILCCVPGNIYSNIFPIIFHSFSRSIGNRPHLVIPSFSPSLMGPHNGQPPIVFSYWYLLSNSQSEAHTMLLQLHTIRYSSHNDPPRCHNILSRPQCPRAQHIPKGVSAFLGHFTADGHSGDLLPGHYLDLMHRCASFDVRQLVTC